MKLYRKLRRYWLQRQGMRVAIELSSVNREYQTLVALYGRTAYIYADKLSAMSGRVEALITELEFINAKRDSFKERALIALPVIDESLLGEGK